METDLFGGTSRTSSRKNPTPPLAERMRPRSLEEIVGQDDLLKEDGFLRRVIERDRIPSFILWGPPGVGKTTIARVIARASSAHFVSISAVLSGLKDVRSVLEEARYQQRAFSKSTILFVDEIHRFNKAQQDAFLPHVEDGTVTLIGATTENPSFEVIAPLLSRTRVLVLQPLSEADLLRLLHRALKEDPRGLVDLDLKWQEEALSLIATHASGDARMALNALEVSAALLDASGEDTLTVDLVRQALQQRTLLYDKSGEEHYNLISALHKSLRNSDADASLYWLVRMLESGEDPLYLLRRMVRFASEDIGLADPEAVGRAISALEAFQFLGWPEGKLALAQLAVDLALAPKSNSIYRAYAAVEEDLRSAPREPVPLHLRNAPTALMKAQGYGTGYEYAHDHQDALTSMPCLPEKLRGKRYYYPTGRGREALLKERLAKIRELTDPGKASSS